MGPAKEPLCDCFMGPLCHGARAFDFHKGRAQITLSTACCLATPPWTRRKPLLKGKTCHFHVRWRERAHDGGPSISGGDDCPAAGVPGIREEDERRPATLRNRDFILDVLRDVLPTTGVILEVASGSGEHIVHFARIFPALIFQPPDSEPAALMSVVAWAKTTRVTNVRKPIFLDASQSVWPIANS